MHGTTKTTIHQCDPVGNRLLMQGPIAQPTTYLHLRSSNILRQITNSFNEATLIINDILGHEVQRNCNNSTGAGLAIFSYTYGRADEMIGVQEIDGTLVTFGYDPNYWLTNEQRSGANAYNTSYAYDPAGNRLTKNSGGVLTTCSYDAANQLNWEEAIASYTTYSYDRNGNLATANAGGQRTTFAWDPENRLSGVQNPDGTTEAYAYSGDGQRRQKVAATGSSIYVWDGSNILSESDLDFITQVNYTLFPGYWDGLVSQRRLGAQGPAEFNAVQFNAALFSGGAGQGTGSSFYGFDEIGNTRILTSAAGAVTDNYLTDSFGVEIATTGTTVNDYQFGGMWGYILDAPNRYGVRARVLYSKDGRWLSRIPSGKGGWLEKDYPYVGNNPLGYVDPSGLAGIYHRMSPPKPYPYPIVNSPVGTTGLVYIEPEGVYIVPSFWAHAFIQFRKPCIVEDGGTPIYQFGFTSTTTVNEPWWKFGGMFLYNNQNLAEAQHAGPYYYFFRKYDPSNPGGPKDSVKDPYTEHTDSLFEARLCACVKTLIKAGPPGYHHHWQDCGSIALRLWLCALRKGAPHV